jgi:hypothetical protein
MDLIRYEADRKVWPASIPISYHECMLAGFSATGDFREIID